MKKFDIHLREGGLQQTSPVGDKQAEKELAIAQQAMASGSPEATVQLGNVTLPAAQIVSVAVRDADSGGAGGYFGNEDDEPPFRRGMSL